MVSFWWMCFISRPHSSVKYCSRIRHNFENKSKRSIRFCRNTIWVHIQCHKLWWLVKRQKSFLTQLKILVPDIFENMIYLLFFQFWYFSRANGLAVKVWIHSGSSPASLAMGSPEGSSNVLVQESCVWSILKPNWHDNWHCFINLLSHSVLGEW